MFGVYDIQETVGQGGMGVVYRAHDTALDRVVALKVLKEDLRQNKQVAARFQREAEAIASLSHPNIIHIYSVGAVGRIPYIAMEFVQGSSLSVVMKRVKALSWKRALHIAEQVADALACAHEAHIIHRDIKPGNILIGANDHAYVTDFGIAKVLTAETQLTVEGSRLGTPHYMSPERCTKGDLTPSSDLYSLGVVLFQMLCGRLPYEANSPVDLIRKIVADPPARLSAYLKDAPEDVERLVAFLIEKKPADRPKSAAYTAELCRRVIDGDPLFEDDGVAKSIRDFRETMPTPSTTSHFDSSLAEVRGFWGRARAALAAIPVTVRIWIVGVGFVAAMAAAGQWTARRSFSDYAIDTVERWDTSAEGWAQSTAAAEFFDESEGVKVVKLNYAGAKIARIAPAGPEGFAVTLLERSAAQSPLVLMLPGARAARVGAINVSPPVISSGADRFVFWIRDRGDLMRGEAWPSSAEDEPSPIISANALASTAGGVVSDLVTVSSSRDGEHVALLARIGGGKTPVLLRADLTDGTNAALHRVSTDGGEVAGIVFGSANELLVLQRRGNAWVVWESTAEGTERPVQEFPAADSDPIELKERGVLMRGRTSRDFARFEWREFPDGRVVELGEASDARVTPDSTRVVYLAPDRRGQLQMWAAELGSPDQRRQLTFLTAGIAGHIETTRDSRFAVCESAHGELPALVVVELAVAEAV